MNRDSWIIAGAFLLLVAIAIYNSGEPPKQVQFYQEVNLEQVSSLEEWERFRRELGLNESDARLENFKLIINEFNEIHSVRFDLVDRNNGQFNVYHYRDCFSCKHEVENEVQITKETLDEWSQYDQMIDARLFFEKMDSLFRGEGSEQLKTNTEYMLIASSGWNEGVAVQGDYFALDQEKLSLIENSRENRYKGFYVQLIGSNRPKNFETNHSTKTIFIANFNEQ